MTIQISILIFDTYTFFNFLRINNIDRYDQQYDIPTLVKVGDVLHKVQPREPSDDYLYACESVLSDWNMLECQRLKLNGAEIEPALSIEEHKNKYIFFLFYEKIKFFEETNY